MKFCLNFQYDCIDTKYDDKIRIPDQVLGCKTRDLYQEIQISVSTDTQFKHLNKLQLGVERANSLHRKNTENLSKYWSTIKES